MTYRDFDLWLIEQARNMPVPVNVQAASQQAQQAFTGGQTQQQLANQIAGQARGTTAGLLNNAAGIYGPLTQFGTSQMTNPQGFGAAYAPMVAQAGTVGSGITAGLGQQAAQRAAATGNLAGLGASQDAIAQGASQGVGSNLQNLAVQNQLLKNQQQQQGAGILGNLYGQNLQGGLTSQGQQTGAVQAGTGAVGEQVGATNALTDASKTGWLQNLEGILGTVASPFRVNFGAGGGTPGCHVAAELYGGWLAPETIAIREFIFTTWWMRPFAQFYARFGLAWSRAIKPVTQGRKVLRYVTKQLFDWFLSMSAHAN